jgi:hypothetical protein
MSAPSTSTAGRARALGRLGFLTRATAIAGVAGTIGFGILAAATYAGQPRTSDRAAPVAGSNDDGTSGTAGTTGDDGPQGQQGEVPSDPFTGGTGDLGAQPVAPPTFGGRTGGGHVSTGGSR